MLLQIFSGILKNAPTPKLPEGFFDSEIKSSPVPNYEQNINKPMGLQLNEAIPTSSADDEPEPMEMDAESKDPLPEGFFDDPVLDAKVS